LRRKEDCDVICHLVYALVLPEPEYKPSVFSQYTTNQQVAIAIACKLGLPVISVDSRLRSMIGTAMPEAAIDKDC
jgi:hypothetical protein